MMERVAVLGLGIMGGGIAANLLKAGYPVTVWNRTASKAEPLIALGGSAAATPREAAANADVIIACVGDDVASRATWLGSDGALAGAKPGAVLIETSTLTPDWVRELAALAADKGCDFLDAPMFGSREAAANGQITLAIGGDEAVFERVKLLLETFTRKLNYLGKTGTGATYKLINNMMGAVHAACAAEGLAMAEAAGLDIQAVAPLILEGPAASRMVQMKLPRMVERRYDETDFSLKWMEKDVVYAMALAEQVGVPLTIAPAALALYRRALEKGFSDEDLAVVAELFR
jgi:3-hydroxyisobutyrate dehydrogenase